ncbi:MAG: hypothetical protein PHT02_00275 [Tissierellia bacterium]|nr:hypothetical protein [Tissierellia bacterium]
MLFILNTIENYFILWFVLICCCINPFKNKIKFILLIIISTVFSIVIQEIKIIDNIGLNMILNMVIGTILYVFILKIYYGKQINIEQSLKYIIIYFCFFTIALELLLSKFYHPFLNDCFIKNNFYKLFISIPLRLLQGFIIMFIKFKKGV